MGHFAKFSSKFCYRMNFENNNGNSLDGINILLEKKEGGKRENVISQKEESCANLKIVELIFFFFFTINYPEILDDFMETVYKYILCGVIMESFFKTISLLDGDDHSMLLFLARKISSSIQFQRYNKTAIKRPKLRDSSIINIRTFIHL